jgi:hypothetical protein
MLDLYRTSPTENLTTRLATWGRRLVLEEKIGSAIFSVLVGREKHYGG